MLRIDRDSFAGAAKLEFLSLDKFATVKLMPDCVSGLVGLATLELKGCGLTSIPAALTALSGSLTRLALPRNQALQVSDEDVKTILILQQLKLLDLPEYAPQAAETYDHLTELAPWSLRSLQHLHDLQAAYHAQHGRLVVLKFCREDGKVTWAADLRDSEEQHWQDDTEADAP